MVEGSSWRPRPVLSMRRFAYYLAVNADGDEPVGWRVPEPIYDAAAVGQTVWLVVSGDRRFVYSVEPI